MPDNTKKPVTPPLRRPGSQVAPGQKPFHRPGVHTATTHSRVPLEQATAGKLYRVRDRADVHGNAAIWGDLLPFDEATKLKEQVVGRRQSKTARVEEMTPVEITARRAENDAAQVEADHLAEVEAVETVADVDLASMRAAVDRGEANAAGDDFTWVVGLADQCGTENGKWADAFIRLSTGRGIRLSTLDETFIHVFFQQMKLVAQDSQLDEIKKRALAAAAPIAHQAQVRAVTPKPRPPAVVADPPKPPPSPLSDLEIEDGPAELPPEEPTLEVGEVQDLMAEVGGGSTGDDVERARKQAELDETQQLQLAKEAYQTAARTSEGGPWPFWEQLGTFEHAGWRYFVMNGGEPPKLVKEPRKVTHSMGVVP